MENNFSSLELESGSLAKLIQRLDEYKNFKYPNDPNFLIPFLLVRKYDINAAIKTILYFFSIRKSIFSGISLIPKDHEELIRYHYGGLLKNCDSFGRPIYIHKGAWNLEIGHTADDLFLFLYFMMIELLKRKDVQNEGVVVVVDCRKLVWAHFKTFGLKGCKNLFNFHYSIPVRVKQVHAVFCPSITHTIYPLAKPFAKEKLKKRMNLYGHDLTSFYEALPKSILPMSLGGDLRDEEAYDSTIVENILSNNEEYKEIQECGFTEDLSLT